MGGLWLTVQATEQEWLGLARSRDAPGGGILEGGGGPLFIFLFYGSSSVSRVTSVHLAPTALHNHSAGSALMTPRARYRLVLSVTPGGEVMYL